MKCDNCNGTGEIEMNNPYWGDANEDSSEPMTTIETCLYCRGSGEVKDDH